MTILPLRFCRAAFVCAGVALVVLPAIPRATASPPKWDPVTPEELADNTPHIEAEAPAEILRFGLEAAETGSLEYVFRVRIKVYDPARAISVTRRARFWAGSGRPDPYYEVAARLTLPDGSSRLFDEHDLREREVATEGRVNGFLGYLGSRSDWSVAEKFLAVTGVEKGAIIDFWERDPKIDTVEMEMISVQEEDVPIRKFNYVSRYQPKNEKEVRRYFVLNRHGGQMTNDEKAGTMTFSASDLPSIHHESFGPPDSYFALTIIKTREQLDQYLWRIHTSIPYPDSVPFSLGPWAYLSTARDFHDSDKGYASKRVKEKAAELVAGATDGREKVGRIYSYVQSLYQRFRNRADLENWYTRYIESIDELIEASGDSATFMTGLNNAYVQAGNAYIDDGGFAITIGQALLTDPVSTGGGLTKSGTGTLTLTGASTYTGNTTISAGTVLLGQRN